jgi:hypothetical protein
LTRTPHGETRWARAVAEGRRLASAAAGDEIALATTADGLVEGPTRDLALIDAALDRVAPSGGEIGAWPHLPNTGRAHFLTDGVISRPLAPDVSLHSVFEPAPNVGITAFSVRPPIGLSNDAPARSAGDAYLEIANFAPEGQRVHLIIARGNATILDRQLDIGRGEALRQVVPLPSGGDALLRARIEAPGNALGIDDEAYAWMTRTTPISVAVVGQQTAWLGELFQRNPDVRASFVLPDAYRPGPADAVIFDRWLPGELPERPILVIAGGAGAEDHPVWKQRSDHPVLRGVDPLTFTIDKAHLSSSPGLVPLVTSERGTPLVSIDQSGGRRMVIVAFGPSESNLGSAPGFPVLIGNALEWLSRPALEEVRRPGAVVLDESVTRVTDPDGQRVGLERVEHSVVAVLRKPGIYVAEGAGARSTIAVNVGDPQLSNTQATTLSLEGSRPVTAGGATRPWWAYCAMAALALLLVEWWTWQRRITV